MLEQAGIAVVGHSALQQRYGILDERVVWYGSADLLSFGRRDASMLRFKNADVAGELLDLVQEAGGRTAPNRGGDIKLFPDVRADTAAGSWIWQSP